MVFDLKKETDKVKFILEKNSLPTIQAEVVLLLDVSGSTTRLFQLGAMQKAIQRVVPVALQFDDNGEIPVYAFNDGNDFGEAREQLSSDNYAEFVRNHITGDASLKKWGGTAYAGVMRKALSNLGFLGREKKKEPKGLFRRLMDSIIDDDPSEIGMQRLSHSLLPAIIYILTDGENEGDDQPAVIDVLRECEQADSQVYFNFLGIGNESFRFLREIADRFPNVGFSRVADIERAGDTDEIYSHLLPSELITWLGSRAGGLGVS